MLKKGDIIYCNVNSIVDLTYGKAYEIIFTRPIMWPSPATQLNENDICIYDDKGL